MLAAGEAIRQLKARYFRFVDTKQWTALRGLFIDEATIHFVQRTDDPEPRDCAIARIASVLQPRVVSAHHGMLAEITFVSKDEATAIWAMKDILVFPDDEPNDFGWSRMEGHGHYHERYVRRSGEWRFASLRLERLLVETRPSPLPSRTDA